MTITTRLVTLSFLSTTLAHAGPSPGKAAVEKAPIAIPTPPPANSWRVTGGVQYRQIGTLDWRTGSRAATSIFPWLAGSGIHGSRGSGITQGQGNHAYTDGYVNPDDGTINDGQTANYGYLSDSQIQNDTLSYHSANGGGYNHSHTYSTNDSLSHPSWSDDLAGTGFFAKLESPKFYQLGRLEISASFGYSYVADDSAHHSNNVFSSLQTTTNRTQAIRLTDNYDVTGLLMPQAPFTGANGGSGYPLISNTPDAREIAPGQVTQDSTSALLTSDVRETFQIKLHTLSLGPDFNTNLGGRVRLGGGLGLGVNIANWDASFSETLRSDNKIIRRYRENNSGTEVLPGLYLEANLGLKLTDHIELYTGGRYDWIGTLDGKVGPSKFSLDLGGWTAMAGISWRF